MMVHIKNDFQPRASMPNSYYDNHNLLFIIAGPDDTGHTERYIVGLNEQIIKKKPGHS